MKIVELDQRTAEWMAWRAEGIGSSDAACIMGVDRFKTRQEMFEIKRRQIERQRNNENTRFGQNKEEEVRQWYMEATGTKVRPACIIHDTIPWLRCSLDGLSEDNKIAQEIKCVALQFHDQALQNRVPSCYVPQVQHQFLVSMTDGKPALDRIDYLSYNSSKQLGPDEHFVRVKVYPDLDYINDKLYPELKRFQEELGVTVEGAHK